MSTKDPREPSDRTIRAACIQERVNRYLAKYEFATGDEIPRGINLWMDNRRIRDLHSWATAEMAEASRMVSDTIGCGWITCDIARDIAKSKSKLELRQIAKI